MRGFKFIQGVILISVFAGCEKELIYEVEDIRLYTEGSDKPNRKTSTEFISIAYADLFGKALSANELSQMNLAYEAFGDPGFIEDLIVRNLLNDPLSVVPSADDLSENPEKEIEKAYQRLYNRIPTQAELYFLTEFLAEDQTVDGATLYYSMMTAEEYRYY